MREGGEGGRGGGREGRMERDGKGREEGEGERWEGEGEDHTIHMYSLDGTDPSHWDQRTHNTSLTLEPEDTQHIPHTGTRGHTTHPLHWDQRTHNTSLTLGPEGLVHLPRHWTHHFHWNCCWTPPPQTSAW